MDIVVNVLYNRAFQVLLGNGNGTFVSRSTYSVGSLSRPTGCTLADWNNDQRLDIIVNSCETNSILLFIGRGDGTFRNALTFSTGDNSCPFASVAGDFDNDRLLDVAVVDVDKGRVGIYLETNYMNGVREATFATGSSHPRAIGLGRFTDKLQLDVIVANNGLGNVGFLQGHPSATFPSQDTFSTGVSSFPTSIAIADFNRDSQLDIVVGNGSFTGLGSSPQAVSTGDFNNDQKLDLAVIYAGRSSVSTMLRYGSIVLTRQADYFAGVSFYPHAVAVGDFNNDGWSDFVAVNRGSESISVFLIMGHATFSSPTAYEVGKGSPSYSIVVGYFNNDTSLDIVVTHFWTNAISIFLGFGNGTFSKPTNYSTGSLCNPIGLATGDFNNDHQLDVVVACNYKKSSIGVFLSRGNGTFSDGGRYFTGRNVNPIYVAVVGVDGLFSTVGVYNTGTRSSPRPVAVADLDKDGHIDIVVGNSGSDNVSVFFGNGDSTFSHQTTYPIESGALSYGLVIHDFNHDGRLDIAVANYGKNSLAILLGLIGRTFFSSVIFPTGDYSQPSYIAVADFNNDHRLNIVTASSGINSASVFLGSTSEDFLIAPAYSIGSTSQLMSIAVGHFDNDTHLDIVVANSGDGSIAVFLANGTGTFLNYMVYLTGSRSQPYSVVVLDIDSDTKLDIVVANYGANSVGVFLGHGNGIFSDQLAFDTGFGSHPFALAVGDVNNDNFTDVVAANNGYGNIDILMKMC